MLDPTLPALVLVAVGLALAGLGLLRRGAQSRRPRAAPSVVGEVVGETHGLAGTWLPVGRFRAPSGREVTGVPGSSSWHGVSRVGRAVAGHPDPGDETRSDAVGVRGRQGGMLVLAGVVVALPGLAAMLLP